MTRRLRDESGFALMGSMLILIILMGLSLFLIARSDTQTNVSAAERVKESSFNLAEAALNAQALQLGRSWPTASTATCDPTTSANSYCPQASAIGNGYTTQDYSSGCATTPIWRTQVRDNGPGTSPQFWTSAVTGQATYDLNADGTVWVRSFATLRCRPVSIVALVTSTSTPITIANTVVTANWLATSNQGRKVIIDTLGAYAQPPSIRPGPAAQPSKVVLRCGAPLGTSPCANYAANKGQIQPPTVQTSSGTLAQALTATQLQALETQAAAAGTLHAPGDCPSGSALSSPANGAPVVIQGPCAISIGSNTQVNTAAKPGVLVIENGTLSLGGTSNFFGLIYMVNKQAASTGIVTIQGNATIQGSVNIDGLGGITAGSSKTNLVYDPRSVALLRGSTGAAVNRGTVRVLPGSTP
jgi:type II secretory pathway pseudopilin PulG